MFPLRNDHAEKVAPVPLFSQIFVSGSGSERKTQKPDGFDSGNRFHDHLWYRALTNATPNIPKTVSKTP